MNNIILTSSGVIGEEFKEKLYSIIKKDDLKEKRLLYITTAIDGEECDDLNWIDEEIEALFDLGIKRENVKEYKIGLTNININDFDIIYMMGGNTIYLLDMIRKNNFDKTIKDFINEGKLYIGESAGSVILGSSISFAKPFNDNNVNMTDFTGLCLVEGQIIPHANSREDYIKEIKDKYNEQIILLNDGDVIIINKERNI